MQLVFKFQLLNILLIGENTLFKASVANIEIASILAPIKVPFKSLLIRTQGARNVRESDQLNVGQNVPDVTEYGVDFVSIYAL